jgi:predicted deacylase
MQSEILQLLSGSPGLQQSLQILRFGTPGKGPKAYLQCALHADEVPAILVAHAMVKLLQLAEIEGRILGEIVLVPFANPIGLAQMLFGQHQGRFDLRDGGNFNRGYAEFATGLVESLRSCLTQNGEENTRTIRRALVQSVGALKAVNPTQDLKNKLLAMSIDADVVLDLHCDTDAVMHLYALTPQRDIAEQLGAAMGARAVLLATESGDSPFDEACTRPWYELQKLLPEFPIALACFGATVELRGEADTQHTLAQQDARGLCDFLALRGVLVQPPATPAVPLCMPTPLSGSEPITAPHAGVVVFHRAPGDRVAAGDVIADVVDALTGQVTALRCKSEGLLYARCGSRWAMPGKRLAKIAGTSLARTGKLLSP